MSWPSTPNDTTVKPEKIFFISSPLRNLLSTVFTNSISDTLPLPSFFPRTSVTPWTTRRTTMRGTRAPGATHRRSRCAAATRSSRSSPRSTSSCSTSTSSSASRPTCSRTWQGDKGEIVVQFQRAKSCGYAIDDFSLCFSLESYILSLHNTVFLFIILYPNFHILAPI